MTVNLLLNCTLTVHQQYQNLWDQIRGWVSGECSFNTLWSTKPGIPL